MKQRNGKKNNFKTINELEKNNEELTELLKKLISEFDVVVQNNNEKQSLIKKNEGNSIVNRIFGKISDIKSKQTKILQKCMQI